MEAMHDAVGRDAVAVRSSLEPGPARRGYVLVVDDDRLIRDCIATTLDDEGYGVATAAHGAAALAELARQWREERRQPDLILLDMRMPVMDGWAFATSYHQMAVPHAPIVVVTAAQDAAARAAQIAADGVLAKPFDLDDLVNIVGRTVRGAA